MRAGARAGEFLRRRHSLYGLSTQHVTHKDIAKRGLSASACDRDGEEVVCSKIPSLYEYFSRRSYCGAAQEHLASRNMEAAASEGAMMLKTMDANLGVESDSSHRIVGEDVRIEMPGVSSASAREEVEVAVEAEGMKELVEGTDVGNLAKRLKVEAPLPHIARAWDHWNKLGAPKLMVAPMVDQSELPFRMLCRKYGAAAAYSPMLHSRLFAQDVKYRTKEFSTCPEDRPLFIQFCANNPDTLLEAAKFVQDDCDYVDINFGCPQRIAKRGNYGAFLMDDLPLVRSLVVKLATGLTTPVSCKIRMFPKLDDTLAYARMLEEAGCHLLAVHGRTRDQKDGKAIRADWEVIKAVKSALRIPVVANGNIRWLEDAEECMRVTGVDGVMSAESLLENPALFAGHRMKALDEPASEKYALDEPALVLEYLELCEKYPVPARMIRAHVHRMLGAWFRRYPGLRDELNREHKLTTEWLKDLVHRLIAQHQAASSGVPETLLKDAGVPETLLKDAGVSEPLKDDVDEVVSSAVAQAAA